MSVTGRFSKKLTKVEEYLDDAVYERYPGFKKTINATLKELHGNDARKFKIVLTKDGSGIGVAVVAAVVAHRK